MFISHLDLAQRETALRAAYPQQQRLLRIASGGIRWLRAHELLQHARADEARLRDTNEAYRRMSANEHRRVLNEIHAELLQGRTLAGGAALYPIRASVQPHVAAWREFVGDCQREVGRSPAFRNALDGLNPHAMIDLGLYRLKQEELLPTASLAHWLRVYTAAFAQGGATGREDATAIERLARERKPKNEEERRGLKNLREIISWHVEERVPKDLPDFEALDLDVRRVLQRADALNLLPINPTHRPDALAAYQQHEAALLERGTASDADDLQAVRELADDAQATA